MSNACCMVGDEGGLSLVLAAFGMNSIFYTCRAYRKKESNRSNKGIRKEEDKTTEEAEKLL